MKIAVIGSGISGLSAAYHLSKKYHVDLFEKDDHFGGHSYTYDIEEKANNKKFGGYCYKHRRKYLMDDDYRKHSCPMIIFDHWTNKCSDYLRTDIISYLRDNWYLYESQYNGINLTDKSKQELFILLASKMNSLKKYDEKDIQRIIQLQIKIKNKKTNLLNRLRGEGYKDKIKCNNESDFYTYDLLSEMDGKYFFSYKDDNDFIWFTS